MYESSLTENACLSVRQAEKLKFATLVCLFKRQRELVGNIYDPERSQQNAYLLLSCFEPLLALFTQHALVEPGPQHTHGGVSVLQLRAGLLTLNCYA